MSHIGKKGIKIPNNVKVTLIENKLIIGGPKGELFLLIPNFLSLNIGKDIINIKVNIDPMTKEMHSCWGTYRTLINNMIVGVNQGYNVKLQLVGIGFRAKEENNILTLKLGFSHNINYNIPEGIKITCLKPNLISIFGVDFLLVSKVASIIRAYKKPEPYKGKGIRYIDEKVKRKEGKKK